MKSLKFVPHLAEMIIRGEKTTTWRLFDDKDISAGDDFIFVNKETGKEFAEAKILTVKEKVIADINDEDKMGHEKVGTQVEMYATYRKYYGDRVVPEAPVKVVKFKIIKFL